MGKISSKKFVIRRVTSWRGIASAARGLGVTQQAVSNYLRYGRGIGLGADKASRLKIVESK